jgi:iron complex outermembrane recepter protein
MSKRSILFSTTAFAFAALTAANAFAQAPAAGGALEEVVVTANKRVENVQDVPKQVQVVSSIVLKEQNITSVNDLSKIVPSLAGNGLAIRGVATGATTISANSKVGIVLDDVPIPSRAGSANNLLDIERTEVLAGPQGTLAGRNATGGLINLVTRSPSLSAYHMILQASATTDFEYTAAAYMTGPLTDKVAFSVSSYYQRFRGLRYNRFNGVWDSNETEGVRGKLLIQPNDDLKITLTGNYSYNFTKGNGGQVFAFIGVPQSTLTNSFDLQTVKRTFAQLVPGTVPSFDNVSYWTPREAKGKTINKTGVFRAEKTLNENNLLTVVASILQEKNPNLQNMYPITLVDMNIRPEYDGWAHQISGSTYKTFETRLTSTGDSPLTYIGGVFLSDNTNTYDYTRYYLPVNWARSFTQSNGAAYGNVSYEFPTGTTIRGGARYEKDHIDYKWIFYEINATTKTSENGRVIAFPLINPLLVSQSSDEDSFINYDLGIQQKVGDDIMLYGTYAKANQGPLYDAEDNVVAQGGFTSQSNVGTLLPVPSEKVKSYEFGVKSQWLDRRLTVNVNYFNSTYDNYQTRTNVTVANDPTARPILKLNAVGSVVTKGVEYNITALPVQGLRVTVNGTYNTAKIQDFKYAPCYTNQTAAAGCITAVVPGEVVARPYQTNLAGKPLASAPKVRVNSTVSYNHPLGLLPDTSFQVAGTVRYNSSSITDILQDPLTARKSATYYNANLSFTHGPYKLDFQGINLTKAVRETYGTGLPAGFTAPPRGADGSSQILTRNLSRDNSRYYQMRLSYEF